jgi:uncharacterized protein YecA (UPF0149 family)
MAGYILKIMIENTHPPVWRRILVPERISFADLHEIIQIIFDWENEHLHGFSIPSKYITIDEDEPGWNGYHYMESKTLIEQFLLDNKWIRYTYDYGDEWRHKIIYEKTDETYDKRYASLLKFKGDSFREDSGGVWGEQDEDWNRIHFDKDTIAQRLEKNICPVRDDLKIEHAEGKRPMDLLNELLELFKQNVETAAKEYAIPDEKSRMTQKIDSWKEYVQLWEDTDGDAVSIEILPGCKTNEELLRDLGTKEAKDYCKYIQLPVKAGFGKDQMTETISKSFRDHPEYLLYVLYENEYKELIKWIKSPKEMKTGVVKERNIFIKALCLGLAEIEIQKQGGKACMQLSFASDLPQILLPLDKAYCRKTYAGIKAFSEKLQKIILCYGLIELESLYDMFCRIYHITMDRKNFNRYLYWHARFNNLVQTGFSGDGKSYVAGISLDIKNVLINMHKYADDLEYMEHSFKEIKQMSDDLSMKNDWFDCLFLNLHYQLQIDEEYAAEIIDDIYAAILNGESLSEVMDMVYQLLPKNMDLQGACELWTCIAGLMMELQLPMLKGRSREIYAREKGISPWEIGMLQKSEIEKDFPMQHMCDFPADIQEAMYNANNYASQQDLKQLLNYKADRKIKSEEFLYLLAEAHITACEFESAEKLIRELDGSSARGKKSAKVLKLRMKTGLEIMDEGEKENAFLGGTWTSESEIKQQPYVRNTPKIGRNDPCPCGSGKKYKQCCGKS